VGVSGRATRSGERGADALVWRGGPVRGPGARGTAADRGLRGGSGSAGDGGDRAGAGGGGGVAGRPGGGPSAGGGGAGSLTMRGCGGEGRFEDPGLGARRLTADCGGDPVRQVMGVIALALGAEGEWRGDTAVVRPRAEVAPAR